MRLFYITDRGSSLTLKLHSFLTTISRETKEFSMGNLIEEHFAAILYGIYYHNDPEININENIFLTNNLIIREQEFKTETCKLVELVIKNFMDVYAIDVKGNVINILGVKKCSISLNQNHLTT